MSYRKAMPKRRPGFVYAFYGYDPRALLRGVIRIVLLYVGQTRQKPETRWRQHQYGSPNGEPPKVWWPLVTQKKVLWDAAWCTNTKLDAKEIRRIVFGKPLMNDKFNRFNTKRIPIYAHKDIMVQIAAAGGVKALVERADGKAAAVAGWSINKDGSVRWYGSQATKVGAKWLQQSTGSLSSSGSLSVVSPVRTTRKPESGITGRVPA